MKIYMDLLKNVGFFAASQLATKLISFLLVPLYTYYLSAGQFGITDMQMTVSSLLLPLATLSITDAVIRFCIDDPKNQREYAAIGIVVIGLGSIFVGFLLPFLDLPFLGGLGRYKLLFWICYVLMSLQTFFSGLSRGVNKVSLMATASIASSIATAISAYVFIAYLHLGVPGFFYSIMAGNAIALILYLCKGNFLLYFSDISKKDILKTTRLMLLYSLPLVPNSLFWWAGNSINRFFITGMLGIAASGLYAAASKIPSLINMVIQIFQQAWNLSAFQATRNNNPKHFFTIIGRIYGAGTILISSCVILLAPWLASIFLQKKFFSAWTLIPILTVALYYNAMNAFFGTLYTSAMKTQYLFTTTIVGAVICILFTALLIRPFGINGAAIATAFSNFIVWILRAIDSKRIMIIDQRIPALISANILLLVQTTAMVFQPNYYFLISGFCATCILLVYIFDSRDLLKILARHIWNK